MVHESMVIQKILYFAWSEQHVIYAGPGHWRPWWTARLNIDHPIVDSLSAVLHYDDGPVYVKLFTRWWAGLSALAEYQDGTGGLGAWAVSFGIFASLYYARHEFPSHAHTGPRPSCFSASLFTAARRCSRPVVHIFSFIFLRSLRSSPVDRYVPNYNSFDFFCHVDPLVLFKKYTKK